MAELPIQPVAKPILCNPYKEPDKHWIYDKETGTARQEIGRRPASYWYKTERTGKAQLNLEFAAEEERDDLPLINLLREDVRRWREADYRGASNVTRDLLRHWGRADRERRLFFCQREAVETIIYLAELRIPGKSSRTYFKNFNLSDADLARLLRGEKPSDTFQLPENANFYPTLVDKPADSNLLPLLRLGCKMATGSGKTVVMAMLIAWAFCNRGQNPASTTFPHVALVCCPNLTVKERLQVLRPDYPDNYYAAFDLVPLKYRPLLPTGKVLVTNWHAFAPESEHREGNSTYVVVNKGPEIPDAFARRVLGELYERLPLLVFNDEGHHCWRPAPDPALAALSAEERRELQQQAQEATVWIDGLDRLNNLLTQEGKPGIAYCVDVSATPFYIKGSGHPEGRPFPWLVSDFGLVDAIESGIVKIPRLPVIDTTGRPDPKYFKLWEDHIKQGLQPAEKLPGRAGKPKPEVVYRKTEGALLQIAGQWVERFKQLQAAAPGQERTPPVLIVICDNTDIAEVFYRKLSGEHIEDVVTAAEVEAVAAEEDEEDSQTANIGSRKKKPKPKVIYGQGEVYPEYFSNTPDRKYTLRIDSKLLAEAESSEGGNKQDAAEALRHIVASVGKPGQPGEHVRCVVSVAMLNEGWDANNVTHILGIRAFGSQLLCEQVVGRGLRRMDYTPDPETGLLTEEYVDVYGIPFSVIPFKGRPLNAPAPEDKPKQHVRALKERQAMEMRFPIVEGYIFALRKNLLRCDIAAMEPLALEPNQEPTATFLQATMGYYEGHAAAIAGQLPFVAQDRASYYRDVHLQTIQFEITRLIIDKLVGEQSQDSRRRVLRLQSRHQLFPQVYRLVAEYIDRKVDFKNCHPCELGLQIYIERIVERFLDAIVPDDTEGEAPLLPILNRYKPTGTTAEVDFKTVRPCFGTHYSHINQVVADTQVWESSAAFYIEQAVNNGHARFYARNTQMGLVIPYEYYGVNHGYEPDYLVWLANEVTLVLEIKGYEDNQDKAKYQAARKWITAVNNWEQLGQWAFHVCRDPQLLEKELAYLVRQSLS